MQSARSTFDTPPVGTKAPASLGGYGFLVPNVTPSLRIGTKNGVNMQGDRSTVEGGFIICICSRMCA